MIELFLASTLFLVYFLYHHYVVKRRNWPPGPPPFPIIGNSLQIDLKLPEKTFLKWKKKYGDIFTVWLPDPVVVLASESLQRECFGRPGETFAGRPQSIIMKLLFKGNWGLILEENDIYKNQRRFALHALKDVGFGKTEFEPFIVGEALKAIDRTIAESEDGICDVRECFTMCNGNIINQLVFGHTSDDKEHMMMLKTTLQNLFSDWFHPRWMILEAMPCLRHLEKIGIDYGINRAHEVNDRFLDFLQAEIDEHIKTFDQLSPPRDFTDAFLSEMKKRPEDSKEFNTWQLKIACYDLWSAAIETSVCTMQHAVLYLLHYPEIQEKIHEELTRVIGREQQLKYEDQARLPYLAAFIQLLSMVTRIQMPFPILLPPSPLDVMEKMATTVDQSQFYANVVERQGQTSAKLTLPSKNRYGRPYISGRPLLTCDRRKIVELFESGMKKIHIAKKLGITHSCVSKVLRRFKETGLVEARVCRTASCACPGSADSHDARYCRHLQKSSSRLQFSIENILRKHEGRVVYYSRT